MANSAYPQQIRALHIGSVMGTPRTVAGVNCIEAGSNRRIALGRCITGCSYSLPDDSPILKLAVTEITNAVDVNHCGTSVEPEQWQQRGEKVNGEVMPSCHGVEEHVSCMLAHDLLNKLAAVIGFCDLLASDQTDHEKEIHLHRLRVTALLMADMLNERSCSLMLYAPKHEEAVENDSQKKALETMKTKVYESSTASHLAI